MNRSRLETVVRIRTLQERIARGEIERERAVAARREDEVDAARRAVEVRAGRAPSSPQAFAAQRAMLTVGTDGITTACDVLAGARRDVEDRVVDWTMANRRLEGVERLDARLTRESRAADALRVQNELDDLVVTRWKRDDR